MLEPGAVVGRSSSYAPAAAVAPITGHGGKFARGRTGILAVGAGLDRDYFVHRLTLSQVDLRRRQLTYQLVVLAAAERIQQANRIPRHSSVAGIGPAIRRMPSTALAGCAELFGK